MKAMVLRKPGPIDQRPLMLEDVPDPSPGPGELLVHVGLCAACRTDLHVVEGELPSRSAEARQRPGSEAAYGAPCGRLPVIPGHQIVGTVAKLGEGVEGFHPGDRVGIAWLHETCGVCAFCANETENLCEAAQFTGWTVNGGYAEFTTVPASFAYRIPDAFRDEEAAPLLCAGIISYRSLRLSGIRSGQRLGLYGFGASAHLAIQVARHWGCEVHVFTRSDSNQALAKRLGAVWVGTSQETPPAKLHASIIFAPAGPLVRDALEVLEKGGTVALAGIYMSPVPQLDYREHLYDEKVVRSVANATYRDGREFLEVAARIPIRAATRTFPLEQANEALAALKTGGITGAAVLQISA